MWCVMVLWSFPAPRILPNLAAGHIALEQGLRGPNHSCSTACATGAHSLGEGLRLLQHGAADAMVCGGVDAAISPLGMLGFASARCAHDLLLVLDLF